MSTNNQFISEDANVPEDQREVVVACVKKYNEQEGKAFYCSGVQQIEDNGSGKSIKLILCSGDLCSMKTFEVKNVDGKFVIEIVNTGGFGF